MRYFMTITGILITLTFLLAILAGSVQASEAMPTQPADASAVIYLALGGGATILAGIVWLGTLQRVERPTSS